MNTALHLTEDQIEDQLIGDLAPEAATHLSACAACQERVAAFEQPLAEFREMSLAWAERRSATMPSRPAAATRPNHRLAWSSLAAAATAAVAVALILPGLQHKTTTAAPVTVASSAPSADEIARDNQMLDAIDRALNEPVAEPASAPVAGAVHHVRSRKDRA